MAVPVDRKAILAALDELEGGRVHFVDRKTGKVTTVTLEDVKGLEAIKKVLATEPTRYTQIPRPEPRENLAEVNEFIAVIQDLRFRDVLKRTLTSHKPFREFRDALNTKIKEKREWDAFHKKNLELRADRFIKSSGLG